LRSGNLQEAAVASLPLVGMGIGASIGSVVPGPGTLAGATIGAAVGAIAQLGVQVFRSINKDDPIVKFEERNQVFLESAFIGMGLSDSQAEKASKRLRDVNKDLIGVGPLIGPIAAQLDQHPQALLQWLIAQPEAEIKHFAKTLLKIDINAEAIDTHLQHATSGPLPSTSYSRAELLIASQEVAAMQSGESTQESRDPNRFIDRHQMADIGGKASDLS